MSQLFFRLRLVPEDEAADVRQLLDDSNIPWFETSAGRWGVSFAAIWLRDEEDYPRARALLDNYQQQRRESGRAAVRESFVDRLIRMPLQIVLALTVVIAIVYFSVAPFLRFLDAQ